MTLRAPTIALAACASIATFSAQGQAVSAFETVRQVLQHPRCQNCHIPGDAPLQFDAGLTHGQNVKRGGAGHGAPGLPCATCHAARDRKSVV